MSSEESRYAVIDVLDEGRRVAVVTIAGDVPDLFVVDALARLDVAARRLGWSARLRAPHCSLAATDDLCGISESLRERRSR